MVTRKKAIPANRRCAYIIFGVTFLAFWMLYLQTPAKPDQASVLSRRTIHTSNLDIRFLITNLTLQSNESDLLAPQYVVHSSKCKIRTFSPYNAEILPYFFPKKYVKCRNKELLTYITKQNNVATLHIDKRYVNDYSSDGIHCCYSTITRTERIEPSKTPDMIFDLSPCIPFKNNATLSEDVILVTCKNGRSQEVYKNTHAVITVNEEVHEKITKKENSNEKHLSVLFVGIDSISRMNLVRSLPITHLYLKKNNWLEFKGYNKIGDNTFPNLMGILTGMNETTTFKVCNPRILGPLDKCNIIWYDYRKLGFVTGYAEDEADINTFNYLKKGFKQKPTDYYFRAYVLATETHLKCVPVDVVNYCTGPESAGERILNLAREFTSTFRDSPSFGFFWMNSYSHNEINAVSRMDEKIAEFLRDLNRTEIFDNTIVMFISDHGFRFGAVTYTHTGWLEERLPFFYMSVPEWFKKKYPEKYKNLIINTERLTSPYDVYMTLQDILVLSGKNYTINESSACRKCKSLFEETEKERSCWDAGIEYHWCTCGDYVTIPLTSLIAEEAAKFIINEIHRTQVNTGADFEQCENFEFDKVISAGILDSNNSLHVNVTYFLIAFRTEPDAVFQGTVSVNMNTQITNFKLEGSISRLDVYATHSWCTGDSVLKKYCYCRDSWKYAFNSVGSFIRHVGNIFNIF